MNYYVSIMKRLLVLTILIITVGSCSGNKEELTGKEFGGYYNACERIFLEFKENNEVEAVISSTDFVGRFCDKIYGQYEYKHPNVIVTWSKVDPDNEQYKKVMSNPDSIIVNESLDTLTLYERKEEFVLSKATLYNITPNAPLMQQLYEYYYQSILLVLFFIIKYFFYFVIAIALLVLFLKWRNRNKKKI